MEIKNRDKIKLIAAFDYSCSKPAAAIYDLQTNKLRFWIWFSKTDQKSIKKLEDKGVRVVNRNLYPIPKGKLTDNDMILENMLRAKSLAIMVADVVDYYKNKANYTRDEVLIASEGLSYCSAGAAVCNLAGFKYIFLAIMHGRGYRNFETYAPLTIKKKAKCSARACTKDDMIEAMGKEMARHKLIAAIENSPEELKNSANTGWCNGLDDVCDAYWCLQCSLDENMIEQSEEELDDDGDAELYQKYNL